MIQNIKQPTHEMSHLNASHNCVYYYGKFYVANK